MNTHVHPVRGRTSNRVQDIIAIILEWGKTKIQTPEFEDYLKEIEAEYSTLVQNTQLDSILTEMLQGIQEEVNRAKETLSNIELITATEEDDIWYTAQESFAALDRVNFFMEAVNSMITRYNKCIADKALQELDKVGLNIISWLEEGDFSPLRFTRFNRIRREYLNMIPEDKRYLFPWYEIFADYDEDTIEILIQNYDKVLNRDRAISYPEELKDHMAEIMCELKRDKELSSVIQTEHLFHRKLIEAVSKRSSLALWRLGDIAAVDYLLPQGVEKAGVINVSTRLIRSLIPTISNEADRLGWAFLSAFCGPGLSDGQRIEILDKIENKIHEVDTEEASNKVGPILSSLKQWFEGKLKDDWLVQVSFTTWQKLLQEQVVAERVTEPAITPGNFWEALNDLWDKPTILNKVKQKLKNIIEKLLPKLSPQPQRLQAKPIPTLGRRGGAETLELEISLTPINLSFKEKRDEYSILPSPDEINIAAEEEYKKLYNFFGRRSSNVYWCGICLTNEGETETFQPSQITKRNFFTVKSGEYYSLIIGISSNEKELQDLINDALVEKPCPIPDKLNIKLLIISWNHF